MASLPDKDSMAATENESQRIVFQRFLQEVGLNVFKWVLLDLSG